MVQGLGLGSRVSGLGFRLPRAAPHLQQVERCGKVRGLHLDVLAQLRQRVAYHPLHHKPQHHVPLGVPKLSLGVAAQVEFESKI